MLHAKRLERFFNRSHAPGLKIGVSLPYAFDGFLIILPLPFQSCCQNVVERVGGVLPMPMGVVVQLCLAFRREMYFHATNVRIAGAYVNFSVGSDCWQGTGTAGPVALSRSIGSNARGIQGEIARRDHVPRPRRSGKRASLRAATSFDPRPPQRRR